MSLIQQAARLILPGAAQQTLGDTPMFHVRHADQHAAFVAQRLLMAAQHPPWIIQILQHIGIDQAVDRAIQHERQRIALDIHHGHFIEPLRRNRRSRGVLVDAE